MTAAMEKAEIAREARGLVRRARTATLATLMTASSEDPGWPYASLVEMATDMAGAPILLLSGLAQHTVNLKATPRASLMIAGDLPDPEAAELERPRLSLTGRLTKTTEAGHRRRYLARHPHAEDYAGLGDFHFYRFEVARAHLVAGFGRIAWIDAADLILPHDGVAELAAAEEGIIGHMNADHADAIALYATVFCGRAPGPWQMTGVDSEGTDLRNGPDTARLGFDSPIKSALEARKTLVELVHRARAGQGL